MLEFSNDSNRCGVLPVESRRAGRGPGSPPRRSPHKRAGGSSISACGARSRDKKVNTTGQHSKTKSLKILQWNAEGIQKKKEALKIFLHEKEIDVACIQETHLNSNLRFSIRGYTCIRQDREIRPKGGILTLIKNDIPTTDIIMPNSSESEIMGTKLILPDGNINLFNCYFPPDKEIEIDHIQIPDQEDCLILGDMNSHSQSWGYPDLNARGEEIEEWQAENRLILLNKPEDKPTFFSRAWLTSTTPDLAFATDNLSKKCTREVADQLATSDYRPILISIDTSFKISENSTIPRWNYKKANWHLFSKLTDLYTTSINCKTNQVNKSFSAFSKAILLAAKESIPRGARKYYIPNWSDHLQQLHNATIEARNTVENNPCIENNINLKAANAVFRKNYLSAMRKSWHEKTEQLNVDRDGHKLWRIAKCLNQEENRTTPIVIEKDNKPLKGQEAANEFIKFFQSVGQIQINESRNKDVNSEIQDKFKENNPAYSLGMTTNLKMKELDESLKALKPKQAPGPDKISNDMLLHLGPQAKRKLLQLFNASWKSGRIPNIWKKAIMIPILKHGKPRNKLDSYRPISLTSCTCKLMERVINRRLTWILESNNLLTEAQAGFRKGRSTEDQIAFITQEIEDGFQEKKPTTIVWVDLEKAFDKVWEQGLLLKLIQHHISHRMYNWIKEYLNNRKALVCMQGQRSHTVGIKNGVPQGGVLSPTLFLIFINDLNQNLPKKVKSSMYADDLALISTEEYVGTSKFRLQDALDKLNNWSKDWGMSINTKKTTYTIFSLSTKQQTIKLTLDKEALEKNDSPTYLGVTYDPRLTWKNQIDKTQSKGIQRLSLLKKLAGTDWGANHNILKKTYTSYVRPVLEYGATAWGSAAQTNLRKIDKVQNIGLRIMTGAIKTTPIRAMEETAALISLDERREIKILSQFTKLETLERHPLRTKIHKTGTKNRLKRTNFIQESLNLKKKHQLEKITLESSIHYNESPPWDESPLPTIRDHIENIKRKSDYRPTELKEIVNCFLHTNYPSNQWIRVYTDGSSHKATTNGGAGILIEWPDGGKLEKSFATGELSDSHRAEREALALAATMLANHPSSPHSQIVFLTDAKTTLQSLQNSDSPYIKNLRTALTKLNHNSKKTVIQWIPAHIQLAGNEKADTLAKSGRTNSQVNSALYPEEMKKLIVDKINEKWTSSHPNHKKDDAYYKLSRQDQRLIFRLRTGHNRMRQHMFRKLKIGTSEICPCGVSPENADHVLQNCSLYQEARIRHWPQITPIERKLYGELPDLETTAQFISCIGLVI